MRVAIIFIVALMSLLFTVDVLAASGVRGRVAWRGELIAGVKVKAFHKVADIAINQPVAESGPTDLDGIYQLELPAGSYVLTASNREGKLLAGDYFCFYSGSPVQVPVDGYRNVGFNLVRIPEQPPVKPAQRSSVQGQLTFQDEPLEQAYLYVYKDPGKNFKGPGYYIQPVSKGTFKLNLPPGDYYLLARKRMRGGQFGPIEIGDYFNYYHGNPVHIGPGELHEIKIETVTRLSMLEEDVVPAEGVQGQVVGVDGKPLAGLYVFAYRQVDMSGTPDYFSKPTGDDGRFNLELPDAGPFYLLAREAFGGPAGGDELYGKLLTEGGEPVAVTVSGQDEEVVIHAAPKISQ